MKVFWSWQSDLPGKISRHFVREALEEAVEALNEEREIVDADRPEAAIDHDRKGVPGSPDLANIILEKIRNSDVFVADVTPVGQSASQPPKKLMNPNVAIELGYSLRALSDRKLIMIVNSAFGTREDLPFDLRHKSGPIFYNLPVNATKAAIAAAKQKLVSELKIALREIAASLSRKPTTALTRVAAISGNPARFFDPTQFLVNREGDGFREGREQLVVPDKPLAFLRVIPDNATVKLIRTVARDVLNQSQLRPFSHEWHSMNVAINEWGAIAYEPLSDRREILSGTQLHQNCEVWGFDTYLPSPTHTPKSGGPPGIWGANLEEAFQRNLKPYAHFIQNHLEIPPPYTVIAGLTGVRSHILAIPGSWGTKSLGPFLDDPVVIEAILSSTDEDAINAVLLKIFRGVFEAVGHVRPANFRKFPPQAAHATNLIPAPSAPLTLSPSRSFGGLVRAGLTLPP